MPTYTEIFTSPHLSRRERLLYRLPTVVAVGALVIAGAYAGAQNMQPLLETPTQPPAPTEQIAK